MDTHATGGGGNSADELEEALERSRSDVITGLIAAGRTRRSFVALLAATAALPWVDRAVADPLTGEPVSIDGFPDGKFPLFNEATASVIPLVGYQSRIALKDSILKLVRHRVIDRRKYMALSRGSGRVPKELSRVLDLPTDKPILLTSRNASYYVNLLWPIGLSNSMFSNFESPLNGESLSSFASTAGWTVGKNQNGSVYFSKYRIVELNYATEALAVRVARATFRPCCDNSTFFQDCNHGSALLGLLQLGASQGLQEKELYQEALAFNSFWFPDYYIRTALYFKVVLKTEWRDVDPRTVMGSDFSALSPWRRNVQARLEAIPNLIPESQGGANCGA
jgi:hypothetical protein